MANPTAVHDDLQSFNKVVDVRKAILDEEAQKGNENTLDFTVSSHIPVLSFRYTGTHIDLSAVEAEIHGFWYTVIQGARYWSPDNRKHDTLVRLILSAKAKGTLTRPPLSAAIGQDALASSGRQDIATCSDGNRLWSDLPFLEQDLVQEWTERLYQMDYADSHKQHVNLASFVARLLSVGIEKGPAICVLSLFRETLETVRPLSTSSTDKILSVQHLIEALAQLIEYGCDSVIELSNHPKPLTFHGLSPDVLDLGELAVQSNRAIPTSGFSVERWNFWIARLNELALCENKEVAKHAAECLNSIKWITGNIYGPLAEYNLNDE